MNQHKNGFITEQQLVTLNLVVNSFKMYQVAPTLEELQIALDISKTAACERVDNLVAKGYLTKVPAKPRGLTVTPKGWNEHFKQNRIAFEKVMKTTMHKPEILNGTLLTTPSVTFGGKGIFVIYRAYGSIGTATCNNAARATFYAYRKALAKSEKPSSVGF